MIYEGCVNVHLTEGKFHLAQFVDVHSRGELAHRDGKERRLHGLRHDFAERCAGAIKTENANLVLGIVRGLEKWEPLDVVPVRMGNEQGEFYRSRLKFSVESDTKRPDAGAGIKDDNLAVCPAVRRKWCCRRNAGFRGWAPGSSHVFPKT